MPKKEIKVGVENKSQGTMSTQKILTGGATIYIDITDILTHYKKAVKGALRELELLDHINYSTVLSNATPVNPLKLKRL